MPNIEKDILDEILSGSGWSASTFGLRFDRVVVRVLGALRSFAETTPLSGGTIIVAISAPIRSPAKTVDDLKREIVALPPAGTAYAGQSAMIQGNSVRIRRVAPSSECSPKFIGFVHNSDIDPDPMLDLAERWLCVPAP